jgi:fluoride ion exporter CrcB/FEX
MNDLEILGILSALLTLSAFIMNQYGILKNDDIRYDAMNMFAGIGLVFYAVSISAVPFMLTNSVWAVISGIDVVKYFLKKYRGVKSAA